MEASALIEHGIDHLSDSKQILSTAQAPLQDRNYNTPSREEVCSNNMPPMMVNESNTIVNCLHFLKTLTIEPALFLFMFGYMMNMSCFSNLVMDKSCLYYFNYTKDICQNISFYSKEKSDVEILANNYNLYAGLTSLIAAFAMIFIAPWSDKYGRKLPLILACVGTVITDFGNVMCIFFYESSINYLVLIKFPAVITGSFICILTIVYSHVSEVTTSKNRTLKYTTVEVAFTVSSSLGGYAGGMIFKYYGYFYVYLTGMVSHCLTALWIAFVVEETVRANISWAEMKGNFFRLDSFSESWKATIRTRESKGRTKLWMYFLSMCVVIFMYETFAGFGFIYAHHIYNWDLTEYNTVNTIFSLSQFLLMILLVPLFLKVFKLSDPILGILGTLSMMAKNCLIAFAKHSVLIYYLGNAAAFLNVFTSLAIRTGISKIITKEETGLIFSFLATCESIFPMLGTVIATKLFNATIDIFPNITYLSSALFLLIPLLTFLWIYAKRKQGSIPYVDINAQGLD